MLPPALLAIILVVLLYVVPTAFLFELCTHIADANHSKGGAKYLVHALDATVITVYFR